MEVDQLFNFAQTTALVGWALLLFTPKWKSSQYLVKRLIIPLLLGLLYGYLIMTNIFSSDGGFSSLDEIRKLFENKALLLAGWVHYLAFDLFVGTWMLNHSQKLGLFHLWVVPCLLLTFMLGPIGLLVYFALVGIKYKKWAIISF